MEGRADSRNIKNYSGGGCNESKSCGHLRDRPRCMWRRQLYCTRPMLLQGNKPNLESGGAHGVAIIQEYGICDGISTSAYNSNEGGCPTLNASHEQPIYVGSQNGRSGITEDGTATTLTSQEKERPIVGTSAVRRLTPLECERLQGFPDGWTDIGEWVDTKGKKHKEADSPRYKALGNSIALPFWFYLLRRISATYERPATLGSLFDGIGGFPLCWERCNGKGTAVWASEIEEFPIAVTKIRFPE